MMRPVESILSRLERTPAWRQAEEAAAREASERRVELARQRAELLAERGRREAALLRQRETTAARVESARAALDEAEALHREVETGFAELDAFAFRAEAIEGELIALCPPELAEAERWTREAREAALQRFRFVRHERSGPGRIDLTWSNGDAVSAAQEVGLECLSELRSMKVEALPAAKLEARLSKIRARVERALAAIPQQPPAGWAAELAERLGREQAVAESRAEAARLAERARQRDEVARNRRRSEGFEPPPVTAA